MITEVLPGNVSVPCTPARRVELAIEQLRFFWKEMSAFKKGPAALLTFAANLFRGGRLVVAAYRFKRFWYLLLGRAKFISYLWMWPVYWWCRQIGGRHEIKPEAQIGCGFRVIHCSLACVVTPHAVVGRNLYLTGGNVIGRRRANLGLGAVHLGDDVMLGICSLVVGPLKIGDGARIGAGVTVAKDVPANATVIGGPVRLLFREPPGMDAAAPQEPAGDESASRLAQTTA